MFASCAEITPWHKRISSLTSFCNARHFAGEFFGSSLWFH
jgi:hypothetical protein